ncbi:MAG: hypothetical protein ABIJ21_01315 [Nanoarchaeota archaeon]
MDVAHSLSYYKREDIRKEMASHARGKEIGIRYGDFFGRRPDVITYPADILEFAKNKATSFHMSEEIWKNPLHLKQEMSKRELDDLRKGWDLVLDIDCAVLEYSTLAAYFTIKALKHHAIGSVSCKFSGNKGFHIGVPFEAFPAHIHGVETRLLFPEAPQRIAAYIKFLIEEPLQKAILKLEKGNVANVLKKTGLLAGDAISEDGKSLLVERFLAIDTMLIASRHMYRMPYSLHEKSGLASIPINPDEVLRFKKSDAHPENVKVVYHFLAREIAKSEEAKSLVVQAFDFKPKHTEEKNDLKQSYDDLIGTDAVPVEFFPPCILNIQRGLKDGKKRSLFVLKNFLMSLNWDKDMIEKFVFEWNKNNPEPLREVIIRSQLRYAHKVLPPNCSNTAYYKDFGVCTPDNFCARIKNPAQYAKLKALLQKKRGGRKKQKVVKSPQKTAKEETAPSQ